MDTQGAPRELRGAPRGAPRSPKAPPRSLQGIPQGPPKNPKGPPHTSRDPKGTPKEPLRHQHGNKMNSEWIQHGPQRDHNGTSMDPSSPKAAKTTHRDQAT